jgi:hypothetical protein
MVKSKKGLFSQIVLATGLAVFAPAPDLFAQGQSTSSDHDACAAPPDGQAISPRSHAGTDLQDCQGVLEPPPVGDHVSWSHRLPSGIRP